eukprot:scpid48221/ scgid15377/ Protein smoothened; SMOH; Smooth; dSMO
MSPRHLPVSLCLLAVALCGRPSDVGAQGSNNDTTTAFPMDTTTPDGDEDAARNATSSAAQPSAPSRQPSLLYRLGAKLATRSCVPFRDTSAGSGGVSVAAITGLVSNLCHSYANRYQQADGVSLFTVAGNPNASDYERLVHTTQYFTAEFGVQLQYYNNQTIRQALLKGLADVQWDGSTAADMGKRVDLLICTALYPPCEVIDGRLLALQACDWFCEDMRQALLPLSLEMAADGRELEQSRYYILLYSTSHSCIEDDAVTSTSPLARASAASASPPRCQNCTKTACGQTTVTVMESGSALSKSPPGRLCFNASNPMPCPAPFIRTAVSDHWDSTVQTNLDGIVQIARGMLRVNSSFLVTNGSYLPCTLDCDMSTLFTQSERDGVVLTLGIICLFVFILGVFSLGAFILNWKRLNKFPQRLILIVNINVFISIFGICGQFFTRNPESFLCNGDGSRRNNVPDGTAGGSACALLFVLVYYFSMVSVAWWVCLSHAWYLTLPCIKMPDFGRKRNQRWEKWYHLFTWPTVAILTVVQLATRDVGGVHFYGLCWMDNDLARFGYLVLPLCVASLFGTIFLAMGMHSFYNSRQLWRISAVNLDSSPGDGKKQKKVKLARNQVERAMRSLLIKLWILLVAVLIHMLVQIIVGSIRRAHWEEWQHQAELRLTCLLTTCNDASGCPENPDVSVVLLAIPPAASATYALSTFIWAFNMDNVRAWKGFFTDIWTAIVSKISRKGARRASFDVTGSAETLDQSRSEVSEDFTSRMKIAPSTMPNVPPSEEALSDSAHVPEGMDAV